MKRCETKGLTALNNSNGIPRLGEQLRQSWQLALSSQNRNASAASALSPTRLWRELNCQPFALLTPRGLTLLFSSPSNRVSQTPVPCVDSSPPARSRTKLLWCCIEPEEVGLNHRRVQKGRSANECWPRRAWSLLPPRHGPLLCIPFQSLPTGRLAVSTPFPATLGILSKSRSIQSEACHLPGGWKVWQTLV